MVDCVGQKVLLAGIGVSALCLQAWAGGHGN